MSSARISVILIAIFAVAGIGAFMFFLSTTSSPSSPAPSPSLAEQCSRETLSFADASVTPSFAGTPASPKLHPDTGPYRFRTHITREAAKGPDFADHYTVISIGCGTNCTHLTVVDARTGEVVAFGVQANYGAQYRRTSRLLIANPREMLPIPQGTSTRPAPLPEDLTTDHYILENDGTLTHLCSIPAFPESTQTPHRQ